MASEKKKEIFQLIRLRNDSAFCPIKDLRTSFADVLRSLIGQNEIKDLFDYFNDNEHIEFLQEISDICALQISLLHSDDLNSGALSRVAICLSDISKIALIYIGKYSDQKILSLILRVTQYLHDILLSLDDFEGIPKVSDLKLSISRLCEAVFATGVDGSEALVTQLLPYLLMTALMPTSTDSDVKRVSGLRESLMLFDFEDESIESLRGLLLRCFIQPSFLRLSEGKKFLATVVNIDAKYPTIAGMTTLQELIFDVMKPQINDGSRQVCLSYGEILVKAWKQSSNQSSIEDVLQRIVDEAIHSFDRKDFKGLRLVLSVFHDLKRELDVDALLNRIYGPILWRSLKCANGIVRSQSAVLFFDVFPLQDPDLGTEAAEKHLQYQFETLTKLLQDDDHRVRAVAASGSCSTLKEYWEAMPLQETKKILSYLINNLSSDASSPYVRQAVIQGLTILLDQPLCHQVLRKLLPQLSNAIHDTSDKVRLAMVELLCKVKGVRGMHFYDIVPVPHILQRMADDADRPRVQSALTELLINSFYPDDVDDRQTSESLTMVRLQRCLSFIHENVSAAEAFYGCLHQHASVGAVAKLCVILLNLLTQQSINSPESSDIDNEGLLYFNEPFSREEKRKVKVSKSKKFSDRVNDENNKELNGQDSEERFGGLLQDQSVRTGVLRVLYASMQSIQSKLHLTRFQSSLELLSQHFTSGRISSVIQKYKSLLRAPSSSLVGEYAIFLNIATLAYQAIHSAKLPSENCHAPKRKPSKSVSFQKHEDAMITDTLWNDLAILFSPTFDNEGISVDDVIALRQSLVYAHIDYAVATDTMTSYLNQTVESVADADSVGNSRKVTKSSKGLISKAPTCLSPVLEVDIALDILSYVLSKHDGCLNEKKCVLSLSEMVVRISERILDAKEALSSSFSTSIIGRLSALWLTYAIRVYHDCGSDQQLRCMCEWFQSALLSSSRPRSLLLLQVTGSVAIDALAAGVKSDLITSYLAEWIEALNYITEQSYHEWSGVDSDRTRQVAVRFSKIIANNQEKICLSDNMMETMIRRLRSVVDCCDEVNQHARSSA